MKDGAERFKVDGWGSCFVVVDAVALSKAFCIIADLVANDFPCTVTFTLANKLSFQWVMATRHFRSWDKDKNF